MCATSGRCAQRLSTSDRTPRISPRISIVQPSQFHEGTAQTSGSLRRAAISADLGIQASIWGGTFLVEPGARTGIHHHGEQDTIVRAGDFLHVPPWLVHQEINPSPDKPFRWIVVRSTSQPIVVNLPDDAWD
ncbi:MAG TPA: cupin domain-containing protein [Granulicella sp.]|nr:cupin domain-containing protein [Granulicella sp.]